MAYSSSNPRGTRRLSTPAIGLSESRDFFDQLLTQVIKARFRGAADESSSRHMNIVAGSCTASRCQLTADGHSMVVLAAKMLSGSPEIWLTLTPPATVLREPLCTVLRFAAGHGWITSQIDEPVGDLTTWIEGAIAFFLDWAADYPVRR